MRDITLTFGFVVLIALPFTFSSLTTTLVSVLIASASVPLLLSCLALAHVPNTAGPTGAGVVTAIAAARVGDRLHIYRLKRGGYLVFGELNGIMTSRFFPARTFA